MVEVQVRRMWNTQKMVPAILTSKFESLKHYSTVC